MIKKISILFLILLLVACNQKRDNFYNLKFDDLDISVGYDNISLIEGNDLIDDYSYFLNEENEKIINKLVIYVDDLNDPLIKIDDYLLNKGIKDTCDDLNGELIDNNGYACIIHKNIYKRENFIIIYGDILNDDIDSINRIEVYYDK